MERLEPYKGYNIRAYEDWSGQWFAEARKFPNPDWIATPSGHATAEDAIASIKQMIDSSPTGQGRRQS